MHTAATYSIQTPQKEGLKRTKIKAEEVQKTTLQIHRYNEQGYTNRIVIRAIYS